MTDGEIIELFWSRNEDAIRLTQEKYGAYCKSVAASILSSPEDAEECLDDSYLKLWNSIPPRRPESLMAYLVATVRNTALDLLRRLRRRGAEYERSLDEIAELGELDPVLEGERLGEILNRFLASERAQDRALFVCRYYLFMSVEDTAKKYGMSVGTVKSILHRMRGRLKRLLMMEGVSV